MPSEPDYSCMDFAYLLEPEPAPQPDAVIGRGRMTCLTALRGYATKRFTAAGVKDYSIGKYFQVEEKAVNGLEDIHRILHAASLDPKSFVIRGAPTGPQRDRVLRRSRGEDATFRDDPCHWVCLDIDSADPVTQDPAAELRALVDSAPQLKGVSCVAQLSSSWGIKPGVRAHLWFWLEEARTSQQVSEWAAGLPFRVDHALFNPVQPHYTAAPIFEGIEDPVTTPRVFLLSGQSDELYIPEGTAQAELDHWVEAIVSLDDDAPRHPLVNKAAYSLGGWVGAGALDLDDTRDTIFTACVESGVFESSRLDSIKREIESGLRDGSLRPRQSEDWKAGMIRNKDGAIKALPDNFLRLFREHPAMAGVLGYDVRSGQPLIQKAPPWRSVDDIYPRSIRDADDVEAAAWINRLGIHTSAVGPISAALGAAAEGNAVDQVVDWLEALPAWDGTGRVKDWLPRLTGCEDTLYSRAVGQKFLVSLIARAMRPGCKVDNMLVLVGPQGSLKSTLLRTLVSGVGDWAFTDCLGDIRKPQDYMPTLMGPWLVEVAELSQFTRREVEAVKKFLSTQTDRYRLSYGRRALSIPRRGCIAGTSNTSDFLSDSTGNRRFWPVDVKKLDIKGAQDERIQLFAEALAMYRAGAKWYLEGDEATAAAEAQAAHTVEDIWVDRMREYLDAPALGPVEGDPRRMQTSIDEVIRECLQIPAMQVTAAHSRRVGGILRRFGWVHTHARIKGRRVWVYRRPEEVNIENHE